MSQKCEKKRRYNSKLLFIREFEYWLDEEPPMILFWRWKKWKQQKPILFTDI